MVLRYTIGKDTGTGSRIDDQTNAAELAKPVPIFRFRALPERGTAARQQNLPSTFNVSPAAGPRR